MDTLSKLLTGFLIVLGGIALRSFLIADEIDSYFEDKLLAPLSIAVYMEEEISEKATDSIRKEIKKYGIIFEKNFYSSQEIYSNLKEDPQVKHQLSLVGEDFLFPPTLELGVNKLSFEKLNKILKQLSKQEFIKRIDAPKELFRVTERLGKRMKQGLLVAKWLSLITALILFSAGTYIYYDTFEPEILFGLENDFKFFRIIRPVLKDILFYGILAGISGAFFWDYFSTELDIEIITGPREVLILTAGTLLLSFIFFIINTQLRIEV
ncbi:MAG: permease-like cell division protein FtsX [Elusimicrobiota bacterium]